MYFFELVESVRVVIETLRSKLGDVRLAMLYNLDLGAASNWNLIVSAPWADDKGRAEAIKIIAEELHATVDKKSKEAISRITVLRADDPFVQDMVHLYPTSGSGAPVPQIAAGGVTEGGGFLYYSQALTVLARKP